MSKYLNLINKRFGKLVSIRHLGVVNGKHRKWLCRCDCGVEKEFFHTHLIHRNTTSCGCSRHSRGKNHHRWTGHEEISGAYWLSLQNGAKKRNLEFNLSLEYVWELFLKQDRRCVLRESF